ncbi:hypothetical protein BDV18DRAFT_149788 [Aspergillus unguis]
MVGLALLSSTPAPCSSDPSIIVCVCAESRVPYMKRHLMYGYLNSVLSEVTPIAVLLCSWLPCRQEPKTSQHGFKGLCKYTPT